MNTDAGVSQKKDSLVSIVSTDSEGDSVRTRFKAFECLFLVKIYLLSILFILVAVLPPPLYVFKIMEFLRSTEWGIMLLDGKCYSEMNFHFYFCILDVRFSLVCIF